jgi:predicted DsbA family dithiol-disulfide isomerase
MRSIATSQPYCYGWRVTTLRIDIWSDIACPWCYIGKRHLENALASFPHAEHVEIVWRAFELDPSAPKVAPATRQPMAERLAAKYHIDATTAQAQLERVAGVGANDGLELRFDRMQPGNTFDAHRLLAFAHVHGKQDALKERLFRAYMTDGDAIYDRDVLLACAKGVGLDEAAANAALAGAAYTDEVRADERLARELGISGVPFFVFGGRLAVSGAQPADVLRGALDQAWSDAGEKQEFADGAVCGPDGCD